MSKISEDVKELVIARLQLIPAGKKLSIGSFGDFTKQQLIEHVQKQDSIGLKITEIELGFLRAMKEGKFYD